MSYKIDSLYEKSKKITESPGVYLMKDRHLNVIYVGKAKILKNRVSSYFRNLDKHDPKVLKMVENVFDFDFIVTDSEFEALILECSMIKQYSPKYNILLKDDKGYNYIRITNEDYPKITAQKMKNDDGSSYIGPYMSGTIVGDVVDEVNKIFMLPICNRKFPKDFLKERPCLNYYIKTCSGVCRGDIESKDYNKTIEQAVEYIKKGSGFSVENLTKQMYSASESMEYEKAAKIRDRINSIKKFSEKQNVILKNNKDIDVFGILKNSSNLNINMLIFRKGKLIDKEDIILTDILLEEESVREFFTTYYSDKIDIPSIILVSQKFNDKELVEKYLSKLACNNVKIIIPERGVYKNLVNMAYNNAVEQFSYKYNNKNIAILDQLKKILNLKKTPEYIEIFDVANFSDSTIVAGMVVFKNAIAYKKGYKRFLIKGLDKQDDYASMKQAVDRRLKRYISRNNEEEGFSRLPDLILLDGGKGHVSSVRNIIDTYGMDIPVYGLVKDSNHRTRAISDDGKEIEIKLNKNLFNFLSRIQDEVHRYSISYLRKKHTNKNFQMELTNIHGISVKKSLELFKMFKTKENILKANDEDIAKLIKVSLETVREIKNYFVGN